MLYATCTIVLVPDAAPQSRFRFTVKVPNYPVSPCCRVLHILDLSGMRSVKGTLGIAWQQNESQIQWLEKVMNCGSRAHGLSDLRPGVVFAHFAPIINGTPSSTHPAFPPRYETYQTASAIPCADSRTAATMYSLDTSLTKVGGTSAWSKTLQGELQELRNTWDPLQGVALLGQDISGSSFSDLQALGGCGEPNLGSGFGHV